MPGGAFGSPPRQAQPVDSSTHAAIPNTAMVRIGVFRCRAPIPFTVITEPPTAPSAEQVTQNAGRVHFGFSREGSDLTQPDSRETASAQTHPRLGSDTLLTRLHRISAGNTMAPPLQ